ncbi:MAG: hypothetical protein V4615_10025 [Bacteroidota bacterium]
MILKNNEVSLLYYYWNDPFIGTTNLTYKTFSIDKKGKETLTATIQQTIQPGWRVVKQSARFTHAGTYRVKVYNKENLELATATLTIK